MYANNFDVCTCEFPQYYFTYNHSHIQGRVHFGVHFGLQNSIIHVRARVVFSIFTDI